MSEVLLIPIRFALLRAINALEALYELFASRKIGQDGSLLDIAEGAGVAINHSCGGVCACSTCASRSQLNE